MDYNTNSARESLTRADVFGEPLKNDPNYKLTSPETFEYNCIAFAMGMLDRWIDSSDIPWHWWPPVRKDTSPSSLVEAFKYFGFEECGMDDKVDEQYDKVALYKDDIQWTHAAKVVADGEYHSKFGASFDGHHSGGDVLKAKYGSVFLIMRRLKTLYYLTEERKGKTPGVIYLNREVEIGNEVNHLVLFQGKIFLGDYGKEVKLTPDGHIKLL